MSDAIFNDQTGYPAPQALSESFAARYISPSQLPASTRCWQIVLPDDAQTTAALHEILGILRAAAVWDGVNAVDMAVLVSNTLTVEECQNMASTLKFTANPTASDEAAVATYDFTDSLLSGSRTFQANYGLTQGAVLHAVFEFRAYTEAASRNYTLRPQLAGTNLATITIPLATGYTPVRLDVMMTASNTANPTASINSVSRVTVFKPDNTQLNTTVFNSSSFLQTAAQNFNLFAGWAGAPGGDESSMSLRAGYLEVLRVE